MSNEQVQKTQIRKRIERTIQTKQYESLHVYVEAEDTIEWTTEEEKKQKSEKLTAELVEDFKTTFTSVTDALGLKQIKATVVSFDGPPASKPGYVPQSASSTNTAQSKGDIFDDLKDIFDDLK